MYPSVQEKFPKGKISGGRVLHAVGTLYELASIDVVLGVKRKRAQLMKIECVNKNVKINV